MQINLSTLAALLLLPMMISGCAGLTQGTGRGTPTASVKSACIAIDPIRPNRGKPGGVSTEDIAAALDRDNPVGRVRNLVGDTESTLRQIDKNNAGRQALCGEGDVGR